MSPDRSIRPPLAPPQSSKQTETMMVLLSLTCTFVDDANWDVNDASPLSLHDLPPCPFLCLSSGFFSRRRHHRAMAQALMRPLLITYIGFPNTLGNFQVHDDCNDYNPIGRRRQHLFRPSTKQQQQPKNENLPCVCRPTILFKMKWQHP